jgi:hypothetical protein
MDPNVEVLDCQTVRVTIFRQKNYSAEYRTRRNRRQLGRNSACFVEEKNQKILFRTIFWKRKTLVILFRTLSWKKEPSEFRSKPFLGREKPLEFCSEPLLDEKNLEIRSEPFWEEKKPRNSFLSHFWKRKNFGIPF